MNKIIRNCMQILGLFGSITLPAFLITIKSLWIILTFPIFFIIFGLCILNYDY